MDDRRRGGGIEPGLTRKAVAFVYGVPILLALITISVYSFPVTEQYGELVATSNFALAIVAGLVRGIFRTGIEVPIPQRLSRAVGEGVFAGVVFGITFLAIGTIVLQRAVEV